MNMMLMNATLSRAYMEEPVSTSLTASPVPARLEHTVSLEKRILVTLLEAPSNINLFSAL